MFYNFLDEEIKRKIFRGLLKDLDESRIRNQGTVAYECPCALVHRV